MNEPNPNPAYAAQRVVLDHLEQALGAIRLAARFAASPGVPATQRLRLQRLKDDAATATVEARRALKGGE